MVPAPDEFPDFDSMSPEEQMAWLESLARRQGANADEFLTAADQTIPVPEDAEIDEPGYVPYSIREGGRMEHGPEAPREPEDTEDAGPEEPDTEEPDATEEAADEEFPPVLEDVEFQADAFVTAPEMNDPDAPSETGIADMEEEAIDETLTDEDLADPMTWLDSLTPHAMATDAELLAEIERAAEEDEFRFDLEAQEPGRAERSPVSDLLAALDFDTLEDFDLDGFEESDLADEGRAEGELPAPREETGAADDETNRWLESFADRPGAEDEGRAAPAADAETPRAVDESALRAAAGAQADDLDTLSDAEADAVDEWAEDDVLGGADPMTWLETLARRQGADLDELTTEADLEIPELPEDTVVDEPGYTEYSPFGILPPRREAATQFESLLGQTEDRAEQRFEAPAELESLSASLGWLSEMTGEPEGDLTAWLAVEDTFAERELRADDDAGEADAAERADPLAGMTDEEIELALRRGELTGEQELAWLQRTARDRVAPLGEDLDAAEPADVEPAEPAELPSWLQAMRDASAVDQEAVDEAGDLFAAEAPEAEAALDEEGVSEADLAAFLEDQGLSGEAEALAEALGVEMGGGVEAEPEEAAFAEAVPIDMPDWLLEADEESGADTELPAWLSEPLQESAAPAEEMPDWLGELHEADAAEMRAAAGEAMPSVEVDSLPEPEFFATQREAPIPEGELFATYRQRLEEEPGDHASRLALARTLRVHGEIAPSLDHYEALVESAQLLEDVSNDLASLVEEQPHQPRARRLLGDTLMRQGRLQDALDAYRTALEQL